MIVIPDKGLAPSVKKHNCDTLIVADWILSSALFGEADVSRSDITDTLMDNQVYQEQDFCSQFIDQVWQYLNDFFIDAPSESLKIDGRAIRFEKNWKHDLGLTYCLIASIRQLYDKWASDNFSDYLVQGAILESLTKISLSNVHPNLKFSTTGWSGINSNQKFSDLVRQICDEARFSQRDLALWDNGKVKDLGLDVYGFLPGLGSRPGTNFMMYQCASGSNWTEKRKTPDLDIWEDIIKFYTSPTRGMAIPFFVDDETFKKSLVHIQGPLLDRTTLLSRIENKEIPIDLKNQIEDWVSKPIDTLVYE